MSNQTSRQLDPSPRPTATSVVIVASAPKTVVISTPEGKVISHADEVASPPNDSIEFPAAATGI